MTDNFADGGLMNSVSSGQFALGDTAACVSTPDSEYICQGKLAGRTAIPAALARHISIVGGPVAFEQVIGPHAGWIVAVVQHAVSWLERAIGQFPGYAMGKSGDFLLTIPKVDNAVAILVLGSLPKPTFFGFIHLKPEPDCQGNAAPLHKISFRCDAIPYQGSTGE